MLKKQHKNLPAEEETFFFLRKVIGKKRNTKESNYEEWSSVYLSFSVSTAKNKRKNDMYKWHIERFKR